MTSYLGTGKTIYFFYSAASRQSAPQTTVLDVLHDPAIVAPDSGEQLSCAACTLLGGWLIHVEPWRWCFAVYLVPHHSDVLKSASWRIKILFSSGPRDSSRANWPASDSQICVHRNSRIFVSGNSADFYNYTQGFPCSQILPNLLNIVQTYIAICCVVVKIWLSKFRPIFSGWILVSQWSIALLHFYGRATGNFLDCA